MNDFQTLCQQAEKYKRLYPPGTRLELLSMNDPYAPVEPGTLGTVDEALCNIIDKMPQFTEIRGTEYWIANPVMHEENFADKWNEVPNKRTSFMYWIQKVKKDLITDPLNCFGQDNIANQYKQALGKTPVERAVCED